MKELENIIELDDDPNVIVDTEAISQIDSIPGTPFTIIRVDKNYFLALGKYRISEMVDDKDYLIKLITEKDWFTIINVISLMYTELKLSDNA